MIKLLWRLPEIPLLLPGADDKWAKKKKEVISFNRIRIGFLDEGGLMGGCEQFDSCDLRVWARGLVNCICSLAFSQCRHGDNNRVDHLYERQKKKEDKIYISHVPPWLVGSSLTEMLKIRCISSGGTDGLAVNDRWAEQKHVNTNNTLNFIGPTIQKLLCFGVRGWDSNCSMKQTFSWEWNELRRSCRKVFKGGQ